MPTFLIAEDDDKIAQGLKSVLIDLMPNSVVFTTAKVSEALDYAKMHQIDLFCLDIQLDDGSGYELAKTLREMAAYKMTPMVFVTAIPTRELMAFKEIHCYDYIIKPFSTDEIIQTFSTLLQYGINPTVLKAKLKDKTCSFSIEQCDIVYIETVLRKLVVVTLKETFSTNYETLKNFTQQLSPDFLKCHKSFYVNKNHICGIDIKNKVIHLKHGLGKIPMGRQYQNQFKGSDYVNS